MAVCPVCARTYDLANYSSGYAFQCACGQFLTLRGTQLLPTDAHSLPNADAFQEEADTAVARPAHLPVQESPYKMPLGNAHSQASAMASVDEETFDGHHHGYGGYFHPEDSDTHAFESSSESTSITPSPYLAAAMQPQEHGHPDAIQVPQAAYARSWHEPQHEPQPHGMPSGGMMPVLGASGGLMPAMQSQQSLQAFDEAVGAASIDLSEISDLHEPSDEPAEFTQSNIELGEIIPVGTDGRAILAFFCVLFFLGPLAILSGFWSLRRIRRRAGLLKGRFLAWFSIVVGFGQTAAIGLLVAAWVAPSRKWPGVDILLRALGEPVKARRTPYKGDEPTQSPQLEKELAFRLLAHEWNFLKGRPMSRLPQDFALYQEEKERHAFVHWRDPIKGKNHRSLFVFSSDDRWYLALMDVGRPFEVRCKQPGPPRLTAEIANQLISCFWKVRGRFSFVSSHSLYVHQRNASRQAYAYWLLRKKPPQRDERSWYVKSLFHRSLRGEWFLSRYAIRPQRGSMYAFAREGGVLLSRDVARELVQAFLREQDKGTQIDEFSLLKQLGEEASVVWRHERRAWLGQFRRANSGKWYLVHVKPLPRAMIEHPLRSSLTLQEEQAQSLLQRYWRGKPVSPVIRSLQVHQEATQAYARAFWFWPSIEKQKKRISRKIHVFSSLFAQNQKGNWLLLDASMTGDGVIPKATEQIVPDVRFAQRGGPLMTQENARFILRQFWKEDENFVGVQIHDLYIYQEPRSHTATAHWSFDRGGSAQSIRSSFLWSNQGNWFLSRYQMGGSGFSVDVSAEGGVKLSKKIAVEMIQEKLKKEQAEQKKRRVLSPFVFQEGNQAHAWVFWVLREDKEDKIMSSLLHRSSRGKWYLSALQAPFSLAKVRQEDLPL
ncbi:MAG: DUF4190 domain-containing protein [Myxococcales bacterium]|nr:DUF4190 domain-containing protein [Myxococcales bacterium]